MLTPQYYLVEETDPFKIAVNHFIEIVTMSDLHVGDAETEVEIHAAHAGVVSVERDAPVYRDYVAVSTDVFDEQNQLIGKLVTVYAHVDLDLDEADSLFVDGISVQAGEEKFYGGNGPGWTPNLSEPSAGPWEYGYWDPDVGYGYGHPILHGVIQPGTGVENSEASSFALYGASPNPATGQATLVFRLPVESATELKVYDLSGRTVLIETCVYSEGTHEFIVDDLATGVYLIQMTSAEFTATRSFIVLEQ